jgi:hAT family C-terminal dimerisation region
VSIVISESYFNTANRVLTDKRTRLDDKIFQALVLLKDWNDTESLLQDKSWMYSIDWEEVTDVSSSDLSEMMSEMNQQCEEESPFARYSNLYTYNCEEYDYIWVRYIYHD